MGSKSRNARNHNSDITSIARVVCFHNWRMELCNISATIGRILQTSSFVFLILDSIRCFERLYYLCLLISSHPKLLMFHCSPSKVGKSYFCRLSNEIILRTNQIYSLRVGKNIKSVMRESVFRNIAVR